ncbi:MAG: carboxypeptidase-like regulatory domain-containing protein [Candidatus Acidiferrales bacterium]
MRVPFKNLCVRVSFTFLAFVIAAAVMVIAPRAAWAQGTSTGTVTGEVTDNTNAIVPDAAVTITLKSTGTVRTTTTNNEGHYIFVDVDPGSYDVKVTKQGFSETVIANQVVQVGTQLTENVKLQVGSVSTTVTVTETAGAELQTMNSTIGTTIQHQELMNLPNVGRDATTFATLQPGTNINGNTAGAVTDQNTFQLDGGTITDDMSGDNNTYITAFTSNTAGVGVMHSPGNAQAPSGVIPTPVTSIEELKVGVSNQTADFNQGAGGQIQMVTKRGTNAFHGTVYDYYLDNNFGGANTWDDNAAGVVQPTAHYSRFGTAAGGAIPKVNFLGGKWYLFGNYEGFRYPFAESFSRNFPTASLRAGLIKLDGEVVNLNPTATVDPATGKSYAANTATCIATGGCGSIPQGGTDPCPSANGCDPQHLGINPVVQGLWNQYLPLPNDFHTGDGGGNPALANYAGYLGNISLPQTSNFGVVRLDHDFNAKNHFNVTYHYYKFVNLTANQWDVGGFFPGDTKGDYTATAPRPQVPWFYTAGLTTNVTSNLTNDFHYSMTRNFWAYGTNGGVPNVAGYPAALEIGGGDNSGGGASASNTDPIFDPYNTNNQNTRTRFWDGHDNTFRDDLTFIKGNHLFQFGGLYEHSWEEHQRIDNGGTINIYQQDILGTGNNENLKSSLITGMTNYTPTQIVGAADNEEYGNLYSAVLGMVDQTQVLYTRSNGTSLALNTPKSCAIAAQPATSGCMASPPALNQSIIPTYNLYFGDSWHLKPTLTLNYGLGYTIEMPPYSPNEAQDIAVDSEGNPLITSQYFAARKAAALQGISYEPEIGFATINNVAGGPKYPYNPYYGGLSPRISAAWNFSPNTVVRGGWARIFGRLNGVDQVLVPILAPGLMQTVQCLGPQATGGCGGDASTVFRVGPTALGFDGTNAPIAAPPAALPQPWYPGVNSVATGSSEALDPSFKPNRSDEFNLDIQRQLTPKIQVEVGYIGRIIRNEYQAYDLNAVPYMMTEGGQTFASAWGNLMLQTNEGANLTPATPNGLPAGVSPQPFLEAALGGRSSAYCSGFTSCTAAWVANEGGNFSDAGVHDAWQDTSSAGAWVFGRSLMNDPIANSPCSQPPQSIANCGANGQATNLYENASDGYGNYNAGFASISFFDWHGLTMKSNLTYSKSLGTGAVVQATSEFTVTDPWNLNNMYGLQTFDETFSYNLYFNWAVPFYQHRNDMQGRLLGGWSISPLFVAGSGFPDEVVTSTDCESYGESGCIGGESTFENAVALGPVNYTNSRKQGIYGDPANGIGVSTTGQNVLNNPAATFALFRNPILGVDGPIGGAGNMRGLPFWNLDAALNKTFKFTERFSGTFSWSVTNVFNHMQPADPFFALYDPADFGVLGGGGNVQGNIPREMEFGFHVDW